MLERTKTSMVPPCIYTGPVELDKFLNSYVCKFGPVQTGLKGPMKGLMRLLSFEYFLQDSGYQFCKLKSRTQIFPSFSWGTYALRSIVCKCKYQYLIDCKLC